jgi:hypothetical protein
MSTLRDFRVPRRPALVVAAFSLLVSGATLAAPSIGGAASLSSGVSIAAAPSTQAESAGFPAVTVTDIKTGKAYSLAKLAGGKTPVLVWFWAPG